MKKEQFKKIYANTYENQYLVENAKICGCTYCKAMFLSSEIFDWTDFRIKTALCPFCGIDSVLPESDEYVLSAELLSELHEIAFEDAKFDE